MDLRGLGQVEGVVPSRKRDWLGIELCACLNGNKLALDAHIFPVLGETDAHVPKLLKQFVLLELNDLFDPVALVLLVFLVEHVGQDLVIDTSVLFLEA